MGMGARNSEGTTRAQSRALWIALVANGGLAAAEAVGGFVFGSLALLADAMHMVVDVAAIAIALIGQRLLTKPASARHTYGLQRAEVLAGLANGILVLVLAGAILLEAIHRLADPRPVAAAGLISVASVGLVVNLASAWLVAASRSRSLNIRAVLVHMLADAAGSVTAVAAGISVALWSAYWVDSAASLLIVGLLLWAGVDLVRDALQILMEGAPRGMDPGEVEASLASADEVDAVHHLHLWNLSSEAPALSAHVVLSGEVTLHEAQVRGDRLKAMLAERFGIEHATLELECHSCEPEPASQAQERS